MRTASMMYARKANASRVLPPSVELVNDDANQPAILVSYNQQLKNRTGDERMAGWLQYVGRDKQTDRKTD